ncbi:mCG132662 [Mus musculus]|nr:mCG132662 [Mus musculus]
MGKDRAEAQLGQDWCHAHHDMTFTCVRLRAAVLQPTAKYLDAPSCPGMHTQGTLSVTQKHRCPAGSVLPAPLVLSLTGFKWGEQRMRKEHLPPRLTCLLKRPFFPQFDLYKTTHFYRL